MPVSVLKSAISDHPFRPAGIKVSPDLWKELENSGEIERARGYIEGVIKSGIDFPVLDGNIFIEVSFDLDDYEFELPEQPKTKK